MAFLAGEEVFVQRGRIDILFDGFQRMRFDYYADGSHEEIKTTAKRVRILGWGLCGAGGALTFPSVVGLLLFAAGSAWVSEIWNDVEKSYEELEKIKRELEEDLNK